MQVYEVKNVVTKLHTAKLDKLIFLRNVLGFVMIFLTIFFVFWSASDIYQSVYRSKTPTKTISDLYQKLVYYEKSVIENATVCKVNYTDERKFVRRRNENRNDDDELPIIYFVTSTYPQPQQYSELTRLSNTLLHVRNLHWIVADDLKNCSEFLESFLDRIGIPYTHIASPTPPQNRSDDGRHSHSRGVASRLASLKWILKRGKQPSVVYFGDDDNTYDLRLFDEIRYTQKVSMFPVGLVGEYGVSSPLVSDGKIIGFFDSSNSSRKWAVDMCGFAINLEYLEKSPEINMPYNGTHGSEEDEFLNSLGLKYEDIELKANNCTEVLVWHTEGESRPQMTIKIDKKNFKTNETNLHFLLPKLDAMGATDTVTDYGWKMEIGRYGKAINITTDNFDSLMSNEIFN